MVKENGQCRSQTDLVTDAEWYRSVAYECHNREVGIDHSTFCFTPLTLVPGRHLVMSFARPKGQRDFSLRDNALAQYAQSLVAPLVGGALTRFGEPAPSDLSPRVRAVLRCLLEGDGDKQIAARLKISILTVNVHTKAIYRHFGVRSRPKLLARWLRRGWGSRCAWADPE